MNNSQVCHIWANQTQSSGKGSNLFFEHTVIYSYGYHFPIAAFYGDNAVLFNSSGYSNTTAKHQNYARRALAYNVQIIECPDVLLQNGGHAENMAHFETEYKNALLKAKRARLHSTLHIDHAEKQRANARAYCELFALDVPEWVNIGISQAVIDEMHEKSKQAQAAQIAAKKEREEKARADYEEKIKRWKNGESVALPYRHDAPIYLRVNGERVETSRNAQVTIKNARRLYHIVRNTRGTSETCRQHAIENMSQIDGFRIQQIHQNGDIQIGCHFIQWDEIQNLATSQNWVTA